MQKSVILCVDDEPGILKSLERCLVMDNYEVLLACGGEEGLRVLEARGGLDPDGLFGRFRHSDSRRDATQRHLVDLVADAALQGPLHVLLLDHLVADADTSVVAGIEA